MRSKQYVLKADIVKTFQPSFSSITHTVSLRKGLRCSAPIEKGSTAGKHFLDEFPRDIFKPHSLVRHDAIFSGILIEPDEVEEKQ